MVGVKHLPHFDTVNTAKNTSILVTGGTGLLGSYVLRMLVNQGFTNISATCRKNSPFDLVTEVKDKIRWQEGDLTDGYFIQDIMVGVQQVYHCAAVVSYDGRERDEMMRINVESTTNLVNEALHHSIEKFLHVSSIAALGRRKKMPVIDENTKWERSPMNSNYAISKYLSEMEVWRGAAEGLKVAIVNPSVIVGGGFWNKGTARFFKNIANGFKFYPVGGSGFVDVRDVADFMLRLMDSNLQGERYVLNAENLSYEHFFKLVSSSIDAKMPSIKVNSFIQAVAWRVEWLRSRLFNTTSTITKETAENSARTWEFNNAKSLETFDNFAYRSIAESVEDTGNSWKESAGKKSAVLSI